MNIKIEKQSSHNKINENQYKKSLLSYIKSIQNHIEKKPSNINSKSSTKEISQILKEINILFDKILIEKENSYKSYESILKRDEKTIRILYGDLLHEKLLKEILEEKIIVLMQTQTEYEMVKEKTGVIVCDGKVISNERKDNEIVILRTENSTLKNVINDKEKEIDLLNQKIKILNREIVKLRKNKTKTNINININDINNPPSISKKNNKFITIGRTKEKQLLFNTIYSPSYSSQKEITINNFSSSTKNFYKTYHMNTKIMNTKMKSGNKSLDKSGEKSNKIINSQENTIIAHEKLISVNKNKYNQRNSRNKKEYYTNYSSCENILKANKAKYNVKFSNINSHTNSNLKKSKEKHSSSKKFNSPFQEFNSVKYINTNSMKSYKEALCSIPKSTRDSRYISQNISKQNTHIFSSSKFQNSNGIVNSKKYDKNMKKKINGQKTGYLKKKKIGAFRNENTTKENFSILFQRTYNDNFRGEHKKIK